MTNPGKTAGEAVRRAERDLEPIAGDAERQRCDALTCAMRARALVAYRGTKRGLCNGHARMYVEWGPRDRERMAEVLWQWPTRLQLEEARTEQLALDDTPLPARTPGVGHVRSATSPGRSTHSTRTVGRRDQE